MIDVPTVENIGGRSFHYPLLSSQANFNESQKIPLQECGTTKNDAHIQLEETEEIFSVVSESKRLTSRIMNIFFSFLMIRSTFDSSE